MLVLLNLASHKGLDCTTGGVDISQPRGGPGPVIFSESRDIGVERNSRPTSAPLATQYKVRNDCETSSPFRAPQVSYLRLEMMNQERLETSKSPSPGSDGFSPFLVFGLKHPSQIFQEMLIRAL